MDLKKHRFPEAPMSTRFNAARGVPLLLAAMALLWAFPAFAAQPKHIELAMLLEQFMPPKGNHEKELPWSFQRENPMVVWEKKGLRYRGGKVFVSVAGATFPWKQPDGRKFYIPFDISLSGTKTGIDSVNIDTEEATFGKRREENMIDILKAIKMNPKMQIHLIKRRRYLSGRLYYYHLSCSGKDPVILEFWLECGSGGCTNSISILINARARKESLQLAKEITRKW